MEIERRKDYQDLENFKKDFIDLKIEVKESMATIRAFMENTKAYRNDLHNKLVTFSELNAKTFKHIDNLTIRCIERTADYITMKEHLLENKINRSFMKDKSWQFLIGLTLAAFGFLGWVIKQGVYSK